MRTKYNIIRTSDGLLIITLINKRSAERYVHQFNKKYAKNGLDIKLKIVIGDIHLKESEGKIVAVKRNGTKYNGDSK